MNGIEYGLKIADVLTDVETSDLSFKDKIHCIRAMTATVLTAYVGHIKKEYRAKEIIALIEQVKNVVEQLEKGVEV